jgi:hypothetical protein
MYVYIYIYTYGLDNRAKEGTAEGRKEKRKEKRKEGRKKRRTDRLVHLEQRAHNSTAKEYTSTEGSQTTLSPFMT